jgi:hypothetical protein
MTQKKKVIKIVERDSSRQYPPVECFPAAAIRVDALPVKAAGIMLPLMVVVLLEEGEEVLYGETMVVSELLEERGGGRPPVVGYEVELFDSPPLAGAGAGACAEAEAELPPSGDPDEEAPETCCC